MSLLNSQKNGFFYCVLSQVIAAIVIFLIFLVLSISSFNAFMNIGRDMFTTIWDPSRRLYGMLPMLYGSFVVSILSLLLAVPLGLATSIYISEILPSRYRIYAKTAIELLAGIPSIVYGLIGIAFVSLWVADIFHLTFGRTIITAAIILSLMILPAIISLCDDAIKNVPMRYRLAAYGMGLTKYEVIIGTLIPLARPNIIGAILLSVGRAMGETMAVMLLIGSIDRIPSPIFDILVPGQTITSKLGREVTESAIGSLHFSALVAQGLILLIIVVTLTFVAHWLFVNEDRLYE